MTEPTGRPFEVIVVDDIARFALHVWRYLTRSIAYGIGNVPDDGRDGTDPDAMRMAGEGLRDATGELVVRWVSLHRDDWRERLSECIAASTPERRLFFVDVRGPYASRGSAYRVEDPLRLLYDAGVRLDAGADPAAGSRSAGAEVLLVSSYEVGSYFFEGARLAIHAKSAETLEETARRIEVPPAPSPLSSRSTSGGAETDDPDVHVLLTGAGFEMRSDDPLVSLGMPSTAVLLGRCLRALHSGREPQVTDDGRGYPVPPDEARGTALWKAAADRDLDTYWDLLLRREMAKYLEGERPDEEVKLRALGRELEMREEFRQSFLEHDWGYLNQTIDALSLPWDVWLTTNYTRFADRSVALLEAEERLGHRSSASPAHDRRWRVVSTSNEAGSLLKETLHDDDPEISDRRLLFKLHGDLGHVSTMAIARHDKDVTTPFGVPIDSLHWVYVAAEQYLTRRIESRVRRSKNARVYWHVVGHSLYDMLLWRKMEQVFYRTDPRRHRIIVVDYDDEESQKIRDEIASRLIDRETRRSGARPKRSPIVPKTFSGQNARRWLAFLAREHCRAGTMWRPAGKFVRPRE